MTGARTSSIPSPPGKQGEGAQTPLALTTGSDTLTDREAGRHQCRRRRRHVAARAEVRTWDGYAASPWAGSNSRTVDFPRAEQSVKRPSGLLRPASRRELGDRDADSRADAPIPRKTAGKFLCFRILLTESASPWGRRPAVLPSAARAR